MSQEHDASFKSSEDIFETTQESLSQFNSSCASWKVLSDNDIHSDDKDNVEVDALVVDEQEFATEDLNNSIQSLIEKYNLCWKLTPIYIRKVLGNNIYTKRTLQNYKQDVGLTPAESANIVNLITECVMAIYEWTKWESCHYEAISKFRNTLHS